LKEEQMNRLSHALQGAISRNRVAIAIGVTIAVSSSGTAAAISYLVLGGSNSAGATTTLSSSTNGAVLAVKNTNGSGGTSAKGLAITVPTGRAPITVNSTAGKATNLDADKLDGNDASAFGRVVDFHRDACATCGGPSDMVTLGGLTIGSNSYPDPLNPLLLCDLYATTSATGRLEAAWSFRDSNASVTPFVIGTSTPVTKLVFARARSDGNRTVGQLVFWNASTGHVVTVAYSVYPVPNADVNSQRCTFQGTLSAAVAP